MGLKDIKNKFFTHKIEGSEDMQKSKKKKVEKANESETVEKKEIDSPVQPTEKTKKEEKIEKVEKTPKTGKIDKAEKAEKTQNAETEKASEDAPVSSNAEKEKPKQKEKPKFRDKEKAKKETDDDQRSNNKSTFNRRQLPLDTPRFQPTIDQGLTEEQINQRKENNLTNTSRLATSKSVGRIIYENVVTFFNLLLFGIALLLIIFQQYMQLTFLVIAIINTAIGIFQEIKAKYTIDKLKLVTSSSFEVIRGGNKTVLQTEDIVLDDIYILKMGDQIPTDSILKDGKIEVNESLLTGESLPISKKPGDKIYAGSFIVSGSGIVQADLVGDYNYISGIQAKAKELTKPKSELVRSLNAVIKIIGFIVLPLGALTFWTQWLANYSDGKDLFLIAGDTVKAMAASMVGMIPSGMYLLTSVSLATSILSLSKQNALVQDLYSVEMLARVNVLCLDKTGTLTDGTMRVDEILMVDNSYEMDKLVGSYLSSFPESNQTSIALSQKFPLRKEYRVVNTIPFSSARKYSAVEFHNMGTFILGAPEYIYKGKDKTISDYIAKKQTAGYRVVMLCHSENSIMNGEIKDRFKPIAAFTLEDHVRNEAPDTIKWFVENGVAIKIISGDNPLTASEIALKCGVPDGDKCVSLEGLNESQVKEIVNIYTVFGRVSPEQKAIIIAELKRQGKVVGMTGDGVNDLLAMKKADCSVAMANGSSAARNTANLVLMDSNFASMPSAVREGRRVVNNVQRSSALYLMKTIFTIVFTIIVLLTYLNGGNGIKYPFDPNNLLITEMICIGFVSVFLAVQQNDAPIKGHFLSNTFIRAVPAGLCLIIAVGLNYIFYAIPGNFLEFTLNEAGQLTAQDELAFRTLNSLSMTFVGLGMAYNCCSPLFPLSNRQNRYRCIGFGITVFLACVMIFGFGVIPPSSPEYHSFCHQIVGIDFQSLTKPMWLLLIIYLTGISGLLGMLVRFTETSTFAHKMRLEKPEVQGQKELSQKN